LLQVSVRAHSPEADVHQAIATGAVSTHEALQGY